MRMRAPLPLALTLGEPAGIGPDLALAIWQRRVELDLPTFYIAGDVDFLKNRARALGLDIPLSVVTPADTNAAFERTLPVVPLGLAITASPGKPDATSAPAAIASIRRAVADVLAGAAAGVVTTPVAKNVLYQSGFAEPGHTEFLGRLAAEATGQPVHPVMMLWSSELAVVPVRFQPIAGHRARKRRRCQRSNGLNSVSVSGSTFSAAAIRGGQERIGLTLLKDDLVLESLVSIADRRNRRVSSR